MSIASPLTLERPETIRTAHDSVPQSGLIAILRGITPDQAAEAAEAIIAAGFHAIEVPLNSPDPFTSISIIRDVAPRDFPVGAGTVLTVDDVINAEKAGSSIIVSPNMNPDVIRATVLLGLRSYPGVTTPSDGFTALSCGARSLKLFPSSAVGIAGMKAWRSVMPSGTEFIPVGGVDEHNIGDWIRAGATGAGIGSSLYKAGMPTDQIEQRAKTISEAWLSAGGIPSAFAR